MAKATHSYHQMEVLKKDRSVARARSAEVKALDAEYFGVKDSILTGFDLHGDYKKMKRRILKVLGGTATDWKDYKWHRRNRIGSVKVLQEIIHLESDEIADIEKTGGQYRWYISPYYASLMDPENRNCIPSINEYMDSSEIADPPIIKYNSPAPLISRLYPDRLIINVTNQCGMVCRHCLRRMDIDTTDVIYPKRMINEALDYVRKNKEIRDVLLTGGDAFSLSDSQLDHILTELDEIPHVEITRLGSRMPCSLPQRVTPELCKMLEKHDPVYLQTQFNHPREVTPEARKAVNMPDQGGSYRKGSDGPSERDQ